MKKLDFIPVDHVCPMCGTGYENITFAGLDIDSDDPIYECPCGYSSGIDGFVCDGDDSAVDKILDNYNPERKGVAGSHTPSTPTPKQSTPERSGNFNKIKLGIKIRKSNA